MRSTGWGRLLSLLAPLVPLPACADAQAAGPGRAPGRSLVPCVAPGVSLCACPGPVVRLPLAPVAAAVPLSLTQHTKARPRRAGAPQSPLVPKGSSPRGTTCCRLCPPHVQLLGPLRPSRVGVARGTLSWCVWPPVAPCLLRSAPPVAPSRSRAAPRCWPRSGFPYVARLPLVLPRGVPSQSADGAPRLTLGGAGVSAGGLPARACGQRDRPPAARAPVPPFCPRTPRGARPAGRLAPPSLAGWPPVGLRVPWPRARPALAGRCVAVRCWPRGRHPAAVGWPPPSRRSSAFSSPRPRRRWPPSRPRAGRHFPCAFSARCWSCWRGLLRARRRPPTACFPSCRLCAGSCFACGSGPGFPICRCRALSPVRPPFGAPERRLAVAVAAPFPRGDFVPASARRSAAAPIRAVCVRPTRSRPAVSALAASRDPGALCVLVLGGPFVSAVALLGHVPLRRVPVRRGSWAAVPALRALPHAPSCPRRRSSALGLPAFPDGSAAPHLRRSRPPPSGRSARCPCCPYFSSRAPDTPLVGLAARSALRRSGARWGLVWRSAWLRLCGSAPPLLPRGSACCSLSPAARPLAHLQLSRPRADLVGHMARACPPVRRASPGPGPPTPSSLFPARPSTGFARPRASPPTRCAPSPGRAASRCTWRLPGPPRRLWAPRAMRAGPWRPSTHLPCPRCRPRCPAARPRGPAPGAPVLARRLVRPALRAPPHRAGCWLLGCQRRVPVTMRPFALWVLPPRPPPTRPPRPPPTLPRARPLLPAGVLGGRFRGALHRSGLHASPPIGRARPRGPPALLACLLAPLVSPLRQPPARPLARPLRFPARPGPGPPARLALPLRAPASAPPAALRPPPGSVPRRPRLSLRR